MLFLVVNLKEIRSITPQTDSYTAPSTYYSFVVCKKMSDFDL